jgi:hypothetical protein
MIKPVWEHRKCLSRAMLYRHSVLHLVLLIILKLYHSKILIVYFTANKINEMYEMKETVENN